MHSKNFKLSALLKLRKNKEQVLQRELGISYQTRDKIHYKRELLDQKQHQIKEDLNEYTQNSIKAFEMSKLYQYSRHIKEAQSRVDEELLDINQVINQVKVNLADAVKDKKILENLQERCHHQWLQEQKEAEQKVVDELISYKYSTNEEEEDNG